MEARRLGRHRTTRAELKLQMEGSRRSRTLNAKREYMIDGRTKMLNLDKRVGTGPSRWIALALTRTEACRVAGYTSY